MAMSELVAPQLEPVSVDEMRSHHRVDDIDESADIAAQIVAARRIVEQHINQRLITQTVRLTFNGFPPVVSAPVIPVQSIDAITYLDISGVEQTLSPSLYRLVRSTRPPFIAPAYSQTWPTTLVDFDSVKVDLVVGYGDNPHDVPEDIRQAIKIIANNLFENRGDVIVGTIGTRLPFRAENLLDPLVLF